MKNKLVNTGRISISNFTFDAETNTISFFSTKTNKCWSLTFPKIVFTMLNDQGENFNQKNLNSLKKLIKNGKN